MKNIEKYYDQIKKGLEECSDEMSCIVYEITHNDNGECGDMKCSVCNKMSFDWLNAEYKEPILTDQEKEDVMKSSQIRKLIEEHPEQAFVCMEEPAELIQAISKCERSAMGDTFAPNDIDNLCEEIADVQIIIRILIQKYRLDVNRIKRWKDTKEKRIVKRYGL